MSNSLHSPKPLVCMSSGSELLDWMDDEHSVHHYHMSAVCKANHTYIV
jgi:hypothetical protein